MWRVGGHRLLVRGRISRLATRTWNNTTFARASSSALEQNCESISFSQQRYRSSASRGHENSRYIGSGPTYRRRGGNRPQNGVDHKTLTQQAKGIMDRLSSSQSPCFTETELAQAVDLVDNLLLSRPKEPHGAWMSLVDGLFNCIIDNSNNNSMQSSPTSNSFFAMIITWSKSDSPQAADRATFWLQQMIDAAEKYPEYVTPPRPTLFSTVLAAWERQASTNPHAAVRYSQELWEQMHQYCAQHTTGNKPAFIPSSAYYMYISLLSKSNLPVKAEEVLLEMIRAGKTNPGVVPSCPVFVNVISAWRRSSSRDAPERAQSILNLLVDEYKRRATRQGDRLKINDAPFNAAIHAWAVSPTRPNSAISHLQAEERINGILSVMQEINLKPSIVTIWSVLPAYEQIKHGFTNTIQDVPKKILHLLDNVNKSTNDHNMLLNQVFSKAIELCCHHSRHSVHDGVRAAEIAEEILFERYMKLPRTKRRLEPNFGAFVSVVEAWKKHCQDPSLDGEERMKAVLQKMEDESNRIYEHKGNPSVYAFVAQAWAKSSISGEGLVQTEENIGRLLTYYKRQSSYALRLNWFHEIITAVQDNYASEESNQFIDRLHHKLAADPLFYKMIASDSSDHRNIDARDRDLLDHVLEVLAREPSSYSGKRAEIILLRMHELHERDKDSQSPTFSTFQKVLNCWSNSCEDGAAQRAEDILLLSEELYNSGDSSMKPSLEGYMAVIRAWSRSYVPEAPEMIKRHLVEIKRRRSEGDTTFAANDQLYAALICSYARSGQDDATSMAQTIFDATPEAMRTTTVYNALIEALGGDSTMAEEILQTMHHAFTIEGNVLSKPDTDSFNAVLQAWLRSGSPMTAWRADGIFKRMQDLSRAGQLDVKPNSRTFDLVILALAQGVDVELKIESYLSLLKQHYDSGECDCAPTATSYTEAIRVWCSKDDDPRAFLRAKALLDEMHELARDGVDSARPDRTTYEVYLRALSQSSIEARAQLASDVLVTMRENDVIVDDEMQRVLQRCYLPVDGQLSSWIIKMKNDELI